MPPVADPEEITDVEAAVPVAVDRPPEENGFAFPLLGNEMRFGDQVVENICVQDRLVRQPLAELVAFNPFAVLLAFVAVERILLGFFVPFERTAYSIWELPVVGQNRPAVGNVRLGVAVDDVLRGDNFDIAKQDATDGGEHIPLRELLHFSRSPAISLESVIEFRSLARRHDEPVSHDVFLFGCVTCSKTNVSLASGPNRVFRVCRSSQSPTFRH